MLASMCEREAGTKSEAASGEISISPTMMAVGLSEFASRDRWGESDAEAVGRIYRAMEQVRRSGRGVTKPSLTVTDAMIQAGLASYHDSGATDHISLTNEYLIEMILNAALSRSIEVSVKSR